MLLCRIDGSPCFCWQPALAALALPAAGAAYRLQGRRPRISRCVPPRGTNVRLSEHRGDVVLLAFLGSRCGPVRRPAGGAEPAWWTPTGPRGWLPWQSTWMTTRTPRRSSLARTGELSRCCWIPTRPWHAATASTTCPMLLLIDRAGAIRHVHRDYRSGDEAPTWPRSGNCWTNRREAKLEHHESFVHHNPPCCWHCWRPRPPYSRLTNQRTAWRRLPRR